MRETFEEIYAKDAWAGGSGPGSDAGFCRPLVSFLAPYLRDHRVRSLVDLGCGDMRWMPHLVAAAGLERYVGLEVVPALVARHRIAFDPAVFTFHELDVSAADPAWLPEGDCYWAKDVLQHWPDDAIVRFLDSFFAARPGARLLVANCSHQRQGPRRLDDRHRFAPLHGDHDPLRRFSPETLFDWGGKIVYRLRGPV